MIKKSINWISFKESQFPILTLFCIPYAGGGPQVFQQWHNFLSDDIQIFSAHLPGRGSRILDNCLDNMEEIVAALLPGLSKMRNRSYAIFGHSLGARVAIELCKALSMNNVPLPIHFFASGSPAADKIYREHQIHNLPEHEFKLELEKLNGTPKAILESTELMKLLLPMLRADFKVAETFSYSPIHKLPIDLSIYHGREDKSVNKNDALAWKDLFYGASEFVEFDGGHFFIEQQAEALLTELNRKIESFKPLF